MDFLDLARERFSVLDYEHRQVESEKLDMILETCLSAPTACNNQPQRILLINDDEGRHKLNRVIPSKYYVPAAFLICYDKKAAWLRPMDGKSSGEIDASIAATHMMLEATDLGLGSIWVMYWDPNKMKSELALPEGIEPVALLIVGYASAKAEPKNGHFDSKTKAEIMIE